MKIGFVKYNAAFEIGEHLLGTVGAADLRTGIIESILDAGDELLVYSPPSRETKEFLSTPDGTRRFGKIHFRNSLVVDPGLDLLIVECGPSNNTFNVRVGSEVLSTIAVSNSLIKSYKGLVVYCQTDPALPFIFFPEFFSRDFFTKYASMGGFQDLLQDKVFVVTTPAKEVEKFSECCTTYRYPYPELRSRGIVHFDRWEIHYGCIIPDLMRKHPPKASPSREIVYVGTQRSRKEKFSRYYGGLSQSYQVDVWGKWGDHAPREYPFINWKGILPKGESYAAYNDSLCSIVIGDKSYENTRFSAARFYEILQGGSIPLIDSAMVDTTISDILTKEVVLQHLMVDSLESAKLRVDTLRAYPHYRLELIQDLQRRLSQFSFRNCYQDLKKLVDKYKDLPPTDLSRSSKLFKDLLRERYFTTPREFSKFAMNDYLVYFYGINSDFSSFVLRSPCHPVLYDNNTRCFSCGDLIQRGNVYASRMKCERCKSGDNQDLDMRFETNRNECFLRLNFLNSPSSVIRYPRS